MNDDRLWSLIDNQRMATADLLEKLAPEEWICPSLCEGWTVRDVAAHLNLQQMTLWKALPGLFRHPGSLNHVIHASAKDYARNPVEQLIAGIRQMVGSRRHNVGVTPAETLLDICIHGQDIALPLGRELPVEPEAAVHVANRIWAYAASRRGRSMSRVFRPVPYSRCRFVATDVDWTVGEGAEVRGPILAIILVMTGRLAALPQLTGPGLTILTAEVRTGSPAK